LVNVGSHTHLFPSASYLIRKLREASSSSKVSTSTSSPGKTCSLMWRGLSSKRPSRSASVHRPIKRSRAAKEQSMRSGLLKKPGFIFLARAMTFLLCCLPCLPELGGATGTKEPISRCSEPPHTFLPPLYTAVHKKMLQLIHRGVWIIVQKYLTHPNEHLRWGHNGRKNT